MSVPIEPRVNLICHGMMLFVYRGPDSYEIWIPKPPVGASGDLHQISLTRTRGEINYRPNAAGNLFKSTGGGYLRGEYELALSGATPFSRSQSTFCNPAYDGRYYPSRAKNVVFLAADGSGKLTSQVNPKDPETSPVWFCIKVPYPPRVYRFRPVQFPNKNPYSSGKTQSACQIAPDEMAGITIFTYSQVQPAYVEVRRTLGNNQYEIQKLPINGDHLNLYLYSQEDDISKFEAGHINQFNQMADLTTSNETFSLNLAANKNAVILNPNSSPTDIDPDLTLQDLQSLSELGRSGFRTEEPVECLQGWGT